MTTPCRVCEQPLRPGELACRHCGTRLPPQERAALLPAGHKPRSWALTRLLAFGILFGLGGLHRLYIGRYGSGLLQLLTFGGGVVWQLWDLHRLADNDLPDAYGMPLHE